MSRVSCRKKYRKCNKREQLQKYPKQSDKRFAFEPVPEEYGDMRPVFQFDGSQQVVSYRHLKTAEIETLKHITDRG